MRRKTMYVGNTYICTKKWPVAPKQITSSTFHLCWAIATLRRHSRPCDRVEHAYQSPFEKSRKKECGLTSRNPCFSQQWNEKIAALHAVSIQAQQWRGICRPVHKLHSQGAERFSIWSRPWLWFLELMDTHGSGTPIYCRPEKLQVRTPSRPFMRYRAGM
jgi:hypothetical protein